ncbi:MAG: hypothetical protein KGZ90_05100 [Algoriphagus sp.]|nr:hypothetical protein [Algoriphagus sp.]
MQKESFTIEKESLKEDTNTYFTNRVHLELGLKGKSDYSITTPFPDGNEYSRTFIYFEPHHEGIKINYPNLNGSAYNFGKADEDSEGNKWGKHYSRIRLEKPNVTFSDGVKKENKYRAPAKSRNYPFITPGVLRKYLDGGQIKTLVVVEGEFKAFKAGFDKSNIEGFEEVEFLGIPSIYGFTGGGIDGRSIHEDIIKILIKCRVQNVVFLTDADTFTIKWEKEKELTLRPKNFFNAVKRFREDLSNLVEEKQVQKVFFSSLNTKLISENSKGLDDLLINNPFDKKEIFRDLLEFRLGHQFFTCIDITENQFSRNLLKAFGLDSDENFYSKYQPWIEDRQFIFNGFIYEKQEQGLKKIGHQDAEKYVRIGVNYWKFVKWKDDKGRNQSTLEKWSKTEIREDYKSHKNFISDIPKYDKMNVFPAWLPGTYQRVHSGTIFNIMNPLEHELRPGLFPNTIAFLKHLFRGKSNLVWNHLKEEYEEENFLGDPFSVILDYLTIQFRFPTRKLPVPILVSKEYKTGKTTFLEWLKEIYGENATVMSIDRLGNQFNLHYAWKYIIGLDEGEIAADIKKEKEKLKQMVTSSTIQLEAKGIDTKEVDWYGKLIICSNFADTVIKIEEGENRWFVIKVPPLEKEDNKLKDKLISEIPAWLDYISNRKIFHPDESRIWFNDDYIKTEQYYQIIKNTKDRTESIFEEFIRDKFFTFRVDQIQYSTKQLMNEIKNSGLFKYLPDSKKVTDYLESKRGMFISKKTVRYSFPIGFEVDPFSGEMTDKVKYQKSENSERVFTFHISDWLSPEEIDEDLKECTDQNKENLF